LLSDEHFSVDGTLIEAWASHKSFKPKDGSDDGDGSNFHGQRRKNDTHQSTSDPEAKLYRKADGREAKLCYMGHAVMENRNGLAVGGTVTPANGTAERRASEAMLKKKAKRSGRRITVGEDKAYDTSDHVAALREMNITPHVAQNDSLTKTGKHRSSAIDGRTTRHIGYRISQSCRAMSECIFGWGKQQAPWYCRRGCRFPAQSHRLQSRAHPQAHRRLRPSLSEKPKSHPKPIGKSNKTTRTASIFNVFQRTVRLIGSQKLHEANNDQGRKADNGQGRTGRADSGN
jgi:Transposase DDE domain